MKDKKYYTPDISELCIGYECEYFDKTNHDPGIWKKEIMDSDLWGIAYSSYKEGTDAWEDDLEHTIRTKYLNKEDIESCGWENIKEDESELIEADKLHHGQTYKIAYSSYDHILQIWEEERLIYFGNINSTNELKKVMTWGFMEWYT